MSAQLDFGLGETADMMRETVRRFTVGTDHAFRRRYRRHQQISPPSLAGDGRAGAAWHHRGGGVRAAWASAISNMPWRWKRVSRGSASVGLSYGAHSNLCVNQIRRWGNPEQKRRYLPKLISGEHVGSLAMSEAGSGSDVVSMRLKAEKRGNDRYVLNGTKFWITNAPEADVLVVYAKTDMNAGPKRHHRLPDRKGDGRLLRLAKAGQDGHARQRHRRTGVPGLRSARGTVMGGEGNGVKVLMSGLDYERAVLAAGPLGIMQACLDVVLPYVRERKQFGRPIGSFQLMQAKIADMYVALNSARAYVYAVARACDAGKTTRFDAAGAILLASENAVKTSLEAIQALGGAGYTKEWPVERFLRDAKLYDIGAGTNEIRRFLIGRELIGHMTRIVFADRQGKRGVPGKCRA